MANKILQEFKVGDAVRIKKNRDSDYNLHGLIGTIVIMGESPGVDFGIPVGGLTWDLDGTLKTQTGRFMSITSLESIEWDL